MQIIALVLFWIVIVELLIALNIWLGTLAIGWYRRHKKAKKDKSETHSL